MRRRLVPLLLVALALGVAGSVALSCGEDDDVRGSRIPGDSLTIYSSMPLHGPLAAVSRDIVRAEKLALREAGGRAGRFNIGFVSLDSSDPETGRWDPDQVAENARQAVRDSQTIAYLGELESGASAISVPILNEGGILQVSPRDTYAGLTRTGGRGEPEKYYPSGQRTFARLVPHDGIQARRLVDLMVADDVRRLVLVDDRRLAGMSLGDRVARLAEREGIEIVERKRLDPTGEVPDDLGRQIAELEADALFYGGAYGRFALDALERVHWASPELRLYATDDLAIAPQLPERAGAIAASLAVTGVDPAPRAEERAFERRFEEAYGERPDRQAILGYRAMQLVLEAIERAGEAATERREVIERTLALARHPDARFEGYRVDGDRLIPLGPPL